MILHFRHIENEYPFVLLKTNFYKLQRIEERVTIYVQHEETLSVVFFFYFRTRPGSAKGERNKRRKDIVK